MLKCLNVKMTNTGFTLVEMLVAMTAFLIVIGAIFGIFVLAIQQQRRALASQVLLGQTSYALEYISRALRIADKQLAGNPAPACLSQNGLNYEIPLEYQILGDENLGRGLRFINTLEGNDCQAFFLEHNKLKYKRRINTINEITSDFTSDKLEITSLLFNLSGQSQADYLQPKVTIFLEIKSRGIIQGQPFLKIQTTISQRKLDVQY